MSFLKNYRDFVSNTESPDTYHLWCAMVALSSLVSRKVSVPLGHYNIFANIYVVLVGPPAARKSSAMKNTKAILRHFKIQMCAEATTKEALIREMAEAQKVYTDPKTNRSVQYAPMTVCVTELSQFLAASKENMIDFLTTVWDQDFYNYKTKNKGPNGETNVDEIYGPFLTLLACTTPTWISMYLKADVISGGFSRRAIFVYEDGPDKLIPFPEVTEFARKAWTELVEKATRIKELRGEFEWTPEAHTWYDQWYRNRKREGQQAILGYHESKHDILLKLAMLFAVSERQELILRVEDLEGALALLEVTEVNMERVFTGVGRNELAMAVNTFKEIMRRNDGEISEKALRGETLAMVQEREYLEVINHLRTTEQWVAAEGTDKAGQVRTYYLTTEKARERKLGLKTTAEQLGLPPHGALSSPKTPVEPEAPSTPVA